MLADMEEQVAEVEKWLKTQPQLPPNIDKPFLKRFVYSMYGDIKGTQNLIKLHYKLRNKYDHIFLKRDPLDEESQKQLKVADFLPLPGTTKEHYKLILYRIEDNDADKFIVNEAIKVFFMMADCRFAVDPENLEDVRGEVPIFDMAGFTLKHVTRATLSSIRLYMKFVQEAHPVRIKQIHVLNVPPYLDKVMTIVKPFIKSDLFKLLHFHLPNAETQYEYFPRDMLPEEYGGKAGTLSDLRGYWLSELKEKRDYIMDETKWKMDKSKKPSSQSELIHDIEKLEID